VRVTRRRILLAAAAVLAAGVAAFFAYGFWEAGQIRVTEVELAFDNLPAAFDGFRIIHLTDLHTASYGRVERRLRRVLQRIPADLLVATGDLKAMLRTPDEAVYQSLSRIFEGLEYPWGMVAVAGGHDNGSFFFGLPGRERVVCLLRTSLLLEWRGQRLALLGVETLRPNDGIRGDHEIEESTWVGDVTRRVAPFGLVPDDVPGPLVCDPLGDGAAFRILLAHTPQFLTAARKAGIDLVLAGDTHGGQIRLPFRLTLLLKSEMDRRYASGHFAEGPTQLYVSRGIGTLYVPIRFLCPPEVVVVTLRRRSD